ncbi:MAG: SMC-Scp complex subunit ScpB [Deltaproteobacteria bacterium RBG_19FT_COMBO_58_16]|nr:MAG: SMC-Scp complex subunit ScpB [Deltaproteobacteria bacterium RBG_19FT_COMBO_58_16]
MLDKQELKPILEALIFAADSAIGVDRIAGILEGEDRAAIKEALDELVAGYAGAGRGFTIEEVAGGYQYRTNSEYAPYLRRLFKIGLQRISKAAMEALAIVAYKQPVTRAEVEAIRGVDSGGVLATLMEKHFIRIVGRKELPGRPVVYGTTKEFLETFDLNDLSCLPSLKDIQKMEEENGAQDALPEEENIVRNGPAGEENNGAEAGEEVGAAGNEEAAGPQGPAGQAGAAPDGEEGTRGEGQDGRDKEERLDGEEDFEDLLDEAVAEYPGEAEEYPGDENEVPSDEAVAEDYGDEIEELSDEALEELRDEELPDEAHGIEEEASPDGEDAGDGGASGPQAEADGEDAGEENSSADAEESGEKGGEETGGEGEAPRPAKASEDNGDGGDSLPEKG